MLALQVSTWRSGWDHFSASGGSFHDLMMLLTTTIYQSCIKDIYRLIARIYFNAVQCNGAEVSFF